MPWHLSEDLKRFKRLTMGKPMLMGRRTFESLGRVLPGREHVIVSRNADFQVDHEQCTVWTSLDTALSYLQAVPEVMLVGGATLYQQLLPQVTRLYLTEIEQTFEGDAFFPVFDRSQWHMSCVEAGATTPAGMAYRFVTWERQSSL